MTEQEWLTSDDPEKMYAFIVDASIAIRGKPITERQQRFFVEACRSFREGSPTGVLDGLELSAACEAWISWKRRDLLPDSLRADLLREIIGNPFRPMEFGEPSDRKCNHSFVPSPNGEDRCRFVLSDDGNWGQFHCNMPRTFHSIMLDPVWLTWNNATIPNLIRSMIEEECDECETGCVRCDKCNLAGYVPRAEPQWEMMDGVHDALIEAGCTEVAILNHLKGAERCPYCHGSGLRHGSPLPGEVGNGRCGHCNGTGKLQVRHVRGCWLIELFTSFLEKEKVWK